MADVKISGLPASTVPLAGTEVLPIVQGGQTRQVSIANVTAGRAIAATSITTDTYKAASSSGGALQNSGGTPQLQWGAGGGNNLSVDVAININPANAAVAISPTGTGTVAISPAGALTVNPTAASTMNNVAIGGTTAAAGKFTALEATGVTTVQAGSVSAPAITTTGDTNTGIFFPAADTIAFAEGGSEAMRIDSSANVGIGTNSPATRVDITNGYTTDNNTSLTLTNSQGSGGDNGAISYRTFTGAGYITSAQINSGPGSAFAASYLKFRVADSSQVLQERMRISAAGNVTVSTGNLVMGTAAKGIDFSINPNPAGATSELLNDYEEGTFTPTVSPGSGAITTYTSSGYYRKVGSIVTVQVTAFITTAGTAGGTLSFSLPFTSLTTTSGQQQYAGTVRESAATGVIYFMTINSNTASAFVQTAANGAVLWVDGYTYTGSITYFSA